MSSLISSPVKRSGSGKTGIKCKSLVRAAVVGLAATAMVACGGGSGGEPEDQTPAVPVTADDAVIINNATRNISSAVGGSLTSAQSTTTNSDAVAPLLEIETGGESSSTAVISPDGETVVYEESSSTWTSGDVVSDSYAFEETIADFIRPTMEGGNTTQVRDGNTITIDPDERHLCSQWLEGGTAAEIDECASLFTDLVVRVEAQTEDSGRVTYLLDSQTLANLVYAPNEGSIEISLPGVLTLAQRSESISGDVGELPDVMTGAVKISGSVTNATVGSEAGSFSVDVTEPMRVAFSPTNESLQFGRYKLIGMVTDAATGNGTMSMDIKSMQLQMIDDDITGALSKIELPDFTLNAELSDQGDTVQITNTGFGVPLTYTMNGSVVATIALTKLDALLKDTGMEFGTRLNLEIDVPDLQAFDDDPTLPNNASANLSVSAPGGTKLKEQQNYSTLVESGSLTYSLNLIDGIQNIQVGGTFSEGDCFDSGEDALELVSCE